MTSLLETNKNKITCEFQTIQDNDLLVFTQPYSPAIFQQECFRSCLVPLSYLCISPLLSTNPSSSPQKIEAIGVHLEHLEPTLELIAKAFNNAIQPSSTDKKSSDEAPAFLAKGFDSEIFRECGLTSEEATNLIFKTKKITMEWFEATAFEHQHKKTVRIPLDVGQRKFTLDYRIWMANFFYQKLGMVQSKHTIAYSSEEFTKFGVQPEKVQQEASTISCFRFALLKTGELRAKDMIFFNTFDGDHLLQLIEWGYESALSPMKNDLVVYLDHITGKATHFARYLENGIVESKLGNANPYSHQHHLFNVPPYGKRVVFMRKASE
jgi:hypothetical protein